MTSFADRRRPLFSLFSTSTKKLSFPSLPHQQSSLHRRGMRNSGKFVRRTESIAKCRQGIFFSWRLRESLEETEKKEKNTASFLTSLRSSFFPQNKNQNNKKIHSRCSALMHPMQVPHYFCDDADCPSRHGGGGEAASASASSAVVASDEGSSSGGVVA